MLMDRRKRFLSNNLLFNNIYIYTDLGKDEVKSNLEAGNEENLKRDSGVAWFITT